MKYVVSVWLFLIGLSFTLHASDFYLRDYSEVAIATDLEPDDVLALKIIFDEANCLYRENRDSGYPIKLIIVGEGNSNIKRLRMKKLLKKFYNVPEKVDIEVVAGESTRNNIFPCDGVELFCKKKLPSFTDTDGKKAVEALKTFATKASHPFIIQLKPAQELFFFSLDPVLAKKSSVLLYGSFNLRRTALDTEVLENEIFHSVRNGPFSAQLQRLMDHFSESFCKLGIVEAFGVLGEESSVYCKFPWTDQIRKRVSHSNQPFFSMYRALVHNWNHYLFSSQIEELIASIKTLLNNQMANKILHNLEKIQDSCSAPRFCKTVKMIRQLTHEMHKKIPSLSPQLAQIEGAIPFTIQVSPCVGIQFTLADVCVALATTDKKSLFKAQPVHITVSDRGFLVPQEESDSSVFYYGRVPHEKFSHALLAQLF